MLRKQTHHQNQVISLGLLLAGCLLSCSNALNANASSTADIGRSPFFATIPGLYEQSELITPVQGADHFHRLVTNSSDPHRISLVQFYMATCPDCQGFSPYFRRFVADVAPHWGRVMRVLVVNCNDDVNINLCWSENPTLIVPLVRWYAMPDILVDRSKPSDQRKLAFSPESVSVAHRGFIERHRRDLVSLRRATLRYLSLVLANLREASKRDLGSVQQRERTEQLYESLPLRLRLLERPIEHVKTAREMHVSGASDAELVHELRRRTIQCAKEANRTADSVEQMFVYEPINGERSQYAKMLMADLSNHTCSNERPLMIHLLRSSELLTRMSNLTGKQLLSGPKLIYLATKINTVGLVEQFADFEFELVPIESPSYSKPDIGATRVPRLSRALRTGNSDSSNHDDHTKESQQSDTNFTEAQRRQMEADNINWAPEQLYPNEEKLRGQLSKALARRLPQFQLEALLPVPADLREIEHNAKGISSQETVAPTKEDLTLVRLTDFYRVLAEIVYQNLVSRARLDANQLLADTCFLGQLAHRFPFQGVGRNELGVSGRNDGQTSRGQLFVELLAQTYARRLGQLIKGPITYGTLEPDCVGPSNKSQLDVWTNISVDAKELIQMRQELTEHHKLGLPAASNFRWSYCQGSADHLRGHTCSLWLLFHTLTVHEYLEYMANSNETYSNVDEDSDPQYQFQVRPVNESTTALCDPVEPEAAYVGAKSSQLFLGSAKPRVLTTIVNFVRFHLSCTNCAAHFSCLVFRTPSLVGGRAQEIDSASPDAHLLWLWEAHNRVNLRTRHTHSEDPRHPKHVFPTWAACPSCYLERPPEDTDNPTTRSTVELDQFKFHRRNLVEFLVARYRRSAILNNKIRIEDLFKPPQTKPDIR